MKLPAQKPLYDIAILKPPPSRSLNAADCSADLIKLRFARRLILLFRILNVAVSSVPVPGSAACRPYPLCLSNDRVHPTKGGGSYSVQLVVLNGLALLRTVPFFCVRRVLLRLSSASPSPEGRMVDSSRSGLLRGLQDSTLPSISTVSSPHPTSTHPRITQVGLWNRKLVLWAALPP